MLDAGMRVGGCCHARPDAPRDRAVHVSRPVTNDVEGGKRGIFA